MSTLLTNDEGKESEEEREREEGREREGVPFLLHHPFEPMSHLLTEEKRQRWSRLLSIIHLGNESFANDPESRWDTLNVVLEMFIKEVGARYGFFSRYTSHPVSRLPILKILSFTNLAWSAQLQQLVASHRELEFSATQRTLLTDPLYSGLPVLANDPTHHSAYKGFPDGHPILENFLGLPIFAGNQCVGIVGLGDSTNGKWTQDDVDFLMPFASLIGSLMLMYEMPRRTSPHSSESNSSSEIDKSPTFQIKRTQRTKGSEMKEKEEESPESLMSFRTLSHMSDMLTSLSHRKLTAKFDHLHRPSSSSKIVSKSYGDPSENYLENDVTPVTPVTPLGTSDVSIDNEARRTKSKGLSFAKYRKRKAFFSGHFRQIDYMGHAMSHVFESLSDGIIVFEENLKIVTSNPSAAKMLGCRDALELMDTFIEVDKIICPIACVPQSNERATQSKDRVTFQSEWQGDLKNLLRVAKMSNRVRFEATLNRKLQHKHERDLPKADRHENKEKETKSPKESRKRNEKESEGGVCDDFCYVDLIISSFWYSGETYYSAVFRDMTQDKVYREKDTLLAFLSHEIRNPVQAITLGCQLLLENSRNSTTTTIAKDLYLAADLLHSVVTDTIDYVQISTRNFQPKMEVRNE